MDDVIKSIFDQTSINWTLHKDWLDQTQKWGTLSFASTDDTANKIFTLLRRMLVYWHSYNKFKNQCNTSFLK